ncbi:MAG: GNAT family N-acetyltransferase [Candidatus Pacebacteria bacterium]|nr:GNAT family N-acetyltransferase [Candidatus Paceibacterota bacterium]
MSIKIRKADSGDAYQTTFVLYKTWLDTYPNKEHGVTIDDIEYKFKYFFTEDNLKKRATIIKDYSENEIMLVAEEEGEIIGLVKITKTEDRNEIEAIYVLPGHQRKGVGTMLWNESQKHFNQELETVVNVATYNDKAINFYRNIGFQETGVVWSDEKFRMKSGSIIPQTKLIIKR